jgi:hypothetical protein
LTQYQKGASFERSFIADWNKKGYDGYRMAGSHTEVDVILIRRLNCDYGIPIALCQLKRHKRSAPKPTKAFKDLSRWHFTEKWWVTRKDREQTKITKVD